MTSSPPLRQIGQTGLWIPPLGFGAFKIGRNQGIKYATPYELPEMSAVGALLQGIMQLGCHYIDTAPAYGLSEERIGTFHNEYPAGMVLSTKVGETFINGQSTYDFSRTAVEASLQRSRERLQRDVLDLVLIHAHARDCEILQQTDVVSVLREWRDLGRIRAIGLSGKTPAAAQLALEWCDALMVEYHLQDQSHAEVIRQAAERGVCVLVKKGLASGSLSASEAIRFVLSNPHVTSLVVGGLSLGHFTENWHTALGVRAVETRSS
ncbi:aldo/keto reductase [bacterium]|nr:aldo/keto reductase [bacterium]